MGKAARRLTPSVLEPPPTDASTTAERTPTHGNPRPSPAPFHHSVSSNDFCHAPPPDPPQSPGPSTPPGPYLRRPSTSLANYLYSSRLQLGGGVAYRLQTLPLLHALLAVLGATALCLTPGSRSGGAGVVAADPCAALAWQVFARPSAVLACQNSIPFNRLRDIPVIDTVIKSLDAFYPYRFLAMNPPDPKHFPERVDIINGLVGIRRRAQAGGFRTSRAFNAAIVRTLNLLNDGHTALVNSCFESYMFLLPFPVVGVVERGVMKLRIAPPQLIPSYLPRLAKTVFNFDLLPYAGALVQTIDGKPALQVVLDFANRFVGIYHDVGARLNAAFASRTFSLNTVDVSAGMFAQRSLYPGKDFMTFTVVRPNTARPRTLRVPWMAVPATGTPGFTNSATYWARYCRPLPFAPALASRVNASAAAGASSSSSASATAHGSASVAIGLTSTGSTEGGGSGGRLKDLVREAMSEDMRWVHVVAERKYNAARDWRPPKSLPGMFDGPEKGITALASASASAAATGGGLASSASGAMKLSGRNSWWQVFRLADQTVVITLSTFSVNEKWLEKWVDDMDKAFTLARRYGRRVILDVRNNGGGITALSWWLARLLLGSQRVPVSHFSTAIDFRVGNRLVLDLVRTNVGLYQWTAFSNLQQRPFSPWDPLNYFFPLRNKRWGRGPLGVYSDLSKKAFPSVLFRPSSPLLGRLPFLVLTDGTCFSACAILTHNLKQRYGVRHVTYGGWPGKPLAVGNSCLGFTSRNVQSDIIEEMRPAQRAHPLAPRPFTTYRAFFGMAFANGYINSGRPCEWVFVPGDAHVPSTMANVASPAALWTDAARHFAKP